MTSRSRDVARGVQLSVSVASAQLIRKLGTASLQLQADIIGNKV